MDTPTGNRQLVTHVHDRGDVIDGLGHRGAGGSDDDGGPVAAHRELPGQIVIVEMTVDTSPHDDQRQLEQPGRLNDRVVARRRGVDHGVGEPLPCLVEGVQGAFGGAGGDVSPPAGRGAKQVRDGGYDLLLEVFGVVAAVAEVVGVADVVEQLPGEQVGEVGEG